MLRQKNAKVELHHGIARVQPRGGGQMVGGFRRLALFHIQQSQIKLCHGIIRLQPHRLIVKCRGGVGLADVVKGFAEAIIGGIIVRGHLDGVREDREAVFPISQLD